MNTLLPVPTVILFVIVALVVSKFKAEIKLVSTLSADIVCAIIFVPARVPSTTKSPVVKLLISTKVEPFHLYAFDVLGLELVLTMIKISSFNGVLPYSVLNCADVKAVVVLPSLWK